MTIHHIQPRFVAGEPRVVLPEPPAWMDNAPCASADPEAFFPAHGESAHPARRVCAGCPLQLPCLRYALQENIRDGVWGGLTPKQRRKLEVAR
jgi:WhiB family redox-sensing transcriptional regulator